MRFAFIFCLLGLWMASAGQSATLKSLERRPEKFQSDSVTIFYPVVILANKAAAKRISEDIQKTVFNTETPGLPLDSLLTDFIQNYLEVMTYTVHFNRNGLLSLEIFLEGSGAYPYNYTLYLNYDLATGKRLQLKDIILSYQFAVMKQKIAAIKRDGLRDNMKELKNEKDSGYIDSSLLETGMELINECLHTQSLERFTFNEKELRVYDNCDFPHSLQNMTPVYDIRFPIESIKKYLRPSFIEKLYRK